MPIKKEHIDISGKENDSSQMLPTVNLAVQDAIQTLNNKHQNINFIFCGDSVLHLAAFNAFILKIKSEGITPCGIIINSIPTNRMSQFDSTDIESIPESNFRYLQNGVNYHVGQKGILEKIKSAVINPTRVASLNQITANKLRKSDEVLFLLWPNHSLPDTDLWNVAYSTGKPIVCILLEEGTGSYLERGSASQLMSAKIGIGLTYYKARAKSLLLEILTKRREKQIRKITHIERFGIFNETSEGSLIQNKDFTKWMIESLEKSNNLSTQIDYTNTIVFVATNFCELGPMSIELAVIHEVAIAIQAHGLTLCIRPHPRTREKSCYETAGATIDNNTNLAFETVLAMSETPPLATIGFCSSSQIIANALWGIPAVSVVSILESICEQQGSATKAIRLYISRVKEFEERFQNQIMRVKNIAELNTIIDRLSVKHHMMLSTTADEDSTNSGL